jgi:hypothetical protein
MAVVVLVLLFCAYSACHLLIFALVLRYVRPRLRSSCGVWTGLLITRLGREVAMFADLPLKSPAEIRAAGRLLTLIRLGKVCGTVWLLATAAVLVFYAR